MSALLELEGIWTPQPQLASAVRFPFTPHEVQEDYLAANAPVVLCIVANRAGKTTGATMDDIWRAHGEHPYKPVRLAKRIWVGFPDYPFFVRVTEQIFFDLLPRELLVSYDRSNKHVKIRRIDGGICNLHFVSYEQDPKSWAGAAVDHIHLDERPPERHFRESAARVSTTGGTIGITVTPAEGLDWMEEELYLAGQRYHNGIPVGTAERPDVMVLEGGLAEYDEYLDKTHPYTRGVGRILVPHITKERIEQFARSIKDPAERMIRVFGIYKHRTGGVYKDFRAETHVVPSFPIPEHWELVGGTDPGFNGFATAIDAIDPMGRHFTILEYFSQQNSHRTHITELWEQLYGVDDDHGNMVKAGLLPFLRTDPERSISLYVDTANPQDCLELNERADELKARLVFLQLDQKLKGREAGVKRVQSFLEPSGKRATPPDVDRADGYVGGEPLWYLFDTLYSEWTLPPKGSDSDEGEPMSGSRLVWELKNYKWKKPSPNQAHANDPDENSAGGAHMLAAKRYLQMARIAPPNEEETNKPETPRQRRQRKHAEKLAKKGRR
jgi:phage terminase large subunit-like protein